MYAQTVMIAIEPQELDMTKLNVGNDTLRTETCSKDEPLHKVGISGLTQENNYHLMELHNSHYKDEDLNASVIACDNVNKRRNFSNFIKASSGTVSETDEDPYQDQNINGEVANWNNFQENYGHAVTKEASTTNYNNLKSKVGMTESASILGDHKEMEDTAAEQSSESSVEDADIAISKAFIEEDISRPIIQNEAPNLVCNDREHIIRKTPDRVLRSHKKTTDSAPRKKITESSNDSEAILENDTKKYDVLVPKKPCEIDAVLEAWLNPKMRSADGQKTVECRFCDKIFCNLRGYKAHSHLHKEKYVCGVCDARFIRKVTLKDHMQEHQREKPFACHLCSAKFAVNGHLTRHLNLHAEQNRFKCPHCETCFSQKTQMKAHLRSHNMVMEKPTCLSETEIEREVRLKPIVRNDDGQDVFECRYCHKTFSTLKKYKSHSYYHKEVFECEVCHTRFSRNTSLKVHMRRHTGEKPFSCHLCDSKFSAGGCLNRHLSLHTGKRPFKCPNCDACFSQKVHLNGHMHIHTMDRPFQCSVCGKRYTHKNNLNFHMKRHSQDKPCVCLLCPAKFYSNYELRRHTERAHKNEFTWSCSVCAVKFSDENDVNLHKCCKSGLLLKCPSCESCFNNEKKLKSHLKHTCPDQQLVNT